MEFTINSSTLAGFNSLKPHLIDAPVNLKQTALSIYDYNKNKAESFKSISTVALGDYLGLYYALASENIGPAYVYNILAIADEMTIPGTNTKVLPLFTSATGTMTISPFHEANAPGTWDAVMIERWFQTKGLSDEMCRIAHEKEQSFKTYIQTLCHIFLKLVFKESMNLGTKVGNCILGYRLLGGELILSRNYLQISPGSSLPH